VLSFPATRFYNWLFLIGISRKNLSGSILPELDREWDIPLGGRGGGDIRSRIVERIAASHWELTRRINHLDGEVPIFHFIGNRNRSKQRARSEGRASKMNWKVKSMKGPDVAFVCGASLHWLRWIKCRHRWNVWKHRQRKKSLSIRSSKKCYTDKVKRESSLRRPSSIRLLVLDRARLRTTTDLFLGNIMGREAYLTFCLIPFSNPFFRTNLECKQGKGWNLHIWSSKKKPDLSSDRDSIAVDRGRARITFSIRIRKGIALIACDSLSMLVSGEVPQTRSFKSGPTREMNLTYWYRIPRGRPNCTTPPDLPPELIEVGLSWASLTKKVP